MLSLPQTPGHVLPQDFVDARLPTAALLPVCLHDIGVEPQRLIDLFVCLWWPATVAADQLMAPPPKEQELLQTLDWACNAMVGVCVGVNQIVEGTPTGQTLLGIADEYQALTGRSAP